MRNLLFVLMSVLMALATLAHPAKSFARSTAPLRYLPVQDSGRTKPYDTFARETLQLIYGKQTYHTANGVSRPAVEIVTTWMMVPEHWDNEKFVQINHRGLKTSLKLNEEQAYFSPKEIFAAERLSLVMQELASFRATKKKMDPYQQAASRLESQLGLYQAVKNGTAIRILPPTPEQAKAAQNSAGPGAIGMMGTIAQPEEKWLSISEMPADAKPLFDNILKAFIQSLPLNDDVAKSDDKSSDKSTDKLNDKQDVKQDDAALETAVTAFKTLAQARNPSLYPSERDISIEVHEQELHPFQITWIFYLTAVILLAVSWQADSKWFYRLGWVSAVIAFLFHTYGFGLRIYLTGRPPVSNMYESVVWVSWGAVVFAMIFESISRKRYVLLSGGVVGTLCLIIADMAPTVLDASLQPLQPVLRSNYWLTIHVLTITLSYSAYFLAWALGNIGLFFVLKGEKPTSERPRTIVQSIYRCMQVGVVLLAAGIILGGIWADYSWGRFWGWDPKETWALIALLGYVAVLHGRLVGWIQNFGMMAAAVISFNLVIMAWYGVNYVLGAGLHSYGFGAGGIQYVGSFVILNLVYVGYVAYVRANLSNQKSSLN